MKTSSGQIKTCLFVMLLQVFQILGSNISGELGIRDICCFHLSYLSFIFSDRGRESYGEAIERGGEPLLTHKPFNAVALSTFSSNENFRHLHINLISCLSLLLLLSPFLH